MMKYFIVCILHLISYTSCLRWTPSGLTNITETRISLKMMTTSLKVDVYKGDFIVIVRDLKEYSHSVFIHCFITGYHDNSEIEYSFCKDRLCDVIVPDKSSESNIKAYGLSLNIKTNFSNKKGLLVVINFPPGSLDMSGNYFCKANDKTNKFLIHSNHIQIRDQFYWETNLVKNIDDVKKKVTTDVSRDTVPRVFPCLDEGLRLNPNKPIWIHQEFITVVSWSVCPVKNSNISQKAQDKMSFTICRKYTVRNWERKDNTIKPRPLTEMSQWLYTVNSEGQLIIFDVKPKPTSTDLSYSLMCYRQNADATGINAITTYIYDYQEDIIISGVSFLSVPVEFKVKLEAISPPIQNVNIYARQTGIEDIPKPVVIYVLYRASSSAKATWKFNGAILQNARNRKSDRYRVEFIGDITNEMQGNYSLEVVDGENNISLTIVVTVVGLPTVSDKSCLPLVRYVMENQDTSLSCLYRGRPTELQMNINSVEIRLSKESSSTIVDIEKTYPYLRELNFTISPSIYIVSDQVIMIYKVYNLRRTSGQVVYQDHTVMFSVKNDFGLSLSSTSIYTVPKIKQLILDSPESYNCTKFCSSATRHFFKCKIDISVLEHKELTIDHYWTVSGHRLDELNNPQNRFAKYFTIDPITKDLTLNEFTNSNNTKEVSFVKETLRDNYIVCNLDLKGVADASPPFNYFSSHDISLGNRLKAKITLDYQPKSMAFIIWIVAIIILVIILIILLVLLIRNLIRNKGKTYPLDKLERQHGYDRDKEIQQEKFDPYEHQDDGDKISNNTSNWKLSVTNHTDLTNLSETYTEDCIECVSHDNISVNSSQLTIEIDETSL